MREYCCEQRCAEVTNGRNIVLRSMQIRMEVGGVLETAILGRRRLLLGLEGSFDLCFRYLKPRNECVPHKV